jgi:hypothetical protein
MQTDPTEQQASGLLAVMAGLPKHGTQRARAKHPTTGELNPRGAQRSTMKLSVRLRGRHVPRDKILLVRNVLTGNWLLQDGIDMAICKYCQQMHATDQAYPLRKATRDVESDYRALQKNVQTMRAKQLLSFTSA